jgi:hypothetical protein
MYGRIVIQGKRKQLAPLVESNPTDHLEEYFTPTSSYYSLGKRTLAANFTVKEADIRTNFRKLLKSAEDYDGLEISIDLMDTYTWNYVVLQGVGGCEMYRIINLNHMFAEGERELYYTYLRKSGGGKRFGLDASVDTYKKLLTGRHSWYFSAREHYDNYVSERINDLEWLQKVLVISIPRTQKIWDFLLEERALQKGVPPKFKS